MNFCSTRELLIGTPAACMIAIFSLLTLPPRLAIASSLLGCIMLLIMIVDARQYIIPDLLSLPAIPAGLLASGMIVDPTSVQLVSVDYVLGALAGGASMWVVRAGYYFARGKEGLGLGDVKLAAAAGAWLGWQHLSAVLLLASTLALSYVLLLALLSRSLPSATTKIPLGAFLAPSIWIAWAFKTYAGIA